MVKFSIVTVCLNAENCIRETIQSILEQTTSSYEYIIKDGISTDGTVGIAEAFSNAFAERGITYRIISKKDSGIYDAMNQAILESQGEWILFMNAGDRIANKNVLSTVENYPGLQEVQIVYGDNISKTEEWFRYYKAAELEYIRFNKPFCHQSVFTRRELFGNTGYSLKYRLCSDYHFYLCMYREGKRFLHIPEALSIYDINGVSSDWRTTFSERIRILEDMPVRDEEAIRKVRDDMKKTRRIRFIRKMEKLFMPRLYQKIWERNRRREGWITEKEFNEKLKEQI